MRKGGGVGGGAKVRRRTSETRRRMRKEWRHVMMMALRKEEAPTGFRRWQHCTMVLNQRRHAIAVLWLLKASMEPQGPPLFSCGNCKTPLAFGEDLFSRSYKAKTGPAYLFAHAMNIVLGPRADRQLLTGRFSVAKIYCSNCKEELGWKYVYAYDPKQRYKEGMFILEATKILEQN